MGILGDFHFFQNKVLQPNKAFFLVQGINNKNKDRFSNKSLKSVPKVNISNIFKTKASLYLDEALAYNFDDLLDKGYDLVSNKK